MNEQVGKHKGAVETLLHEKKELSRLLQIVQQQLQRHLSALEDQGVDTDKFLDEFGQQQQQRQQQAQQQMQEKQQQRTQQNQTRQQEPQPRQQKQSQKQEKSREILEEDEDDGPQDFSPL